MFGAMVFVWIVVPTYMTAMGALSTNIVRGTCVPWGAYISYSVEKTITVTLLFAAYLFPFVFIFFCYSRIVYVLRYKVVVVSGAAKSSPLKLFALFSATTWNFSQKFFRFM